MTIVTISHYGHPLTTWDLDIITLAICSCFLDAKPDKGCRSPRTTALPLVINFRDSYSFVLTLVAIPLSSAIKPSSSEPIWQKLERE